MAKRNPIDLVNNPMVRGPLKQAEPPVSGAMDKLTTTGGNLLELLANIMNPKIVDATQLGYTFTFLYNDPFVRGLNEQLLRLTVSQDGRGRTDIKETLEAGSNVPDTYYEVGAKRRELEWEDDEE